MSGPKTSSGSMTGKADNYLQTGNQPTKSELYLRFLRYKQQKIEDLDR